MPNKVYISKITLPINGEAVTFNFMDAEAQQKLAGSLQFVVCYDDGAPDISKIPAGVVVKYNDTSYTGTLAASAAESLTFYLVKSANQVNGKDVYDEYVPIGSANSKSWEKIGDTAFDFSSLKALAFEDSVSIVKGDGDLVLGTGTTFAASTSNVTLKSGASHTTTEVLGAGTTISADDSEVTFTGTDTTAALGVDATFAGSSSDVEFADDPTTGDALGANATFTTTITSTNKYLAGSATGMAIASDGNDVQVLTSIGTNSTDAFYDKADPLKKKLGTVSVYGTDGNESVSAISSIEDGYLSTASVPHVDSVGAADSWTFSYDSSDNELTISGANGGTPISLNGTDTVATGAVQSNNSGASSIVTGFTITSVSAAKKAADATTIATGSLLGSSDEGYATAGAEVVYSLDTNTSNAITALGTQNKATIPTGVTVTNPTIALSLEDSDDTGRVSVGKEISAANISTVVNSQDKVAAITELVSATAKAQTISITDNDAVNVVTTIGTGTAAAQSLTVNNDDLVDIVTGLGSMEAAGQEITVTKSNIKIAKYDDLDVSIS